MGWCLAIVSDFAEMQFVFMIKRNHYKKELIKCQNDK